MCYYVCLVSLPCLSLLRAKQICIGSATENLKIYRITTVLIKMNILSNLSDSEFSIGMAL